MSKEIEKMYTDRIVNACKIIAINSHIITSKNARDVFMASLLSIMHYNTSSVEIIDKIIDSVDLKTCEVTIMINFDFSVIDAILEYRDSIIKSYFKTFGIKEYKFKIDNFI